jgi:phage recombination protein Bet
MAAKTTTQSAPAQTSHAPAAAAGTDNVPALIQSKGGKLIERVAARFGIDPDKMLETLKQTAFRQRAPKGGGEAKPVTNEQMLMLLVVAEEYHLNPFTREIYAFAQDGGIVPIIGIDGWIRMIHEHPQFKSLELRYPDESDGAIDPDNYWVEAIIERKDNEKPFVIREYLKECYRDTDPWNTMPKRMNRHKAIIQCGRVAFGFAGVYDPDEAERIFAAARDVTPRDPAGKPATRPPQAKKTAPVTDVDPTPPAGSTPPIARLTVDQVVALKDQAHEEGVNLDPFLANHGAFDLSELPASSYQLARDWIAAGGAQ